jgi:hypothetical protein
MEHYVGLDVSLKPTAVCLVDRTGKIEREGVVSSDPESDREIHQIHAPHVARVGLETGSRKGPRDFRQGGEAPATYQLDDPAENARATAVAAEMKRPARSRPLPPPHGRDP